ncbi:MAG: hypothetical protein ABR584_01765 [Candidatus Baltobacteraceae bacterium]
MSIAAQMLAGLVTVLWAMQPAEATSLQQRCAKVSHSKNYQAASQACLNAAFEVENQAEHGTAHQRAMLLAQAALDREAAAFGDIHMKNRRSDSAAEDEMQSAHSAVNQALSMDPGNKYIKQVRQRIYAFEAQVRSTVLKRGGP